MIVWDESVIIETMFKIDFTLCLYPLAVFKITGIFDNLLPYINIIVKYVMFLQHTYRPRNHIKCYVEQLMSAVQSSCTFMSGLTCYLLALTVNTCDMGFNDVEWTSVQKVCVFMTTPVKMCSMTRITSTCYCGCNSKPLSFQKCTLTWLFFFLILDPESHYYPWICYINWR